MSIQSSQMCFFSLRSSPVQEAQLVSHTPHRSWVCEEKAQIHSPEHPHRHSVARGACQTTLPIPGCMWKPSNSKHLENNAKPCLILSPPCEQGSRQQFTSILGFLLWPCCPTCFWNALLFTVQAAIGHTAEPAEPPQLKKESCPVWHVNERLCVLMSPGLGQTLPPASSQGRRFSNCLSWHCTTL